MRLPPVFTILRQHAAVPRLSRTTSMEETQPTGLAKLVALLDGGLTPDDEFRELKAEIPPVGEVGLRERVGRVTCLALLLELAVCY